MTISRLGLGSWAFGGTSWAYGWGHQDDDTTIETIHHAVRSGVNWLDTAPVYGFGHAEDVVGRALAGIPPDQRPFLFTKCGLVWGPDADGPGGGQVGRADSIERELDASLRRLRTERLDLYQMHRPACDGTTLEEYWTTLAGLRERGSVRSIGLSNHSLAELRRAHDIAPVDVYAPPLSAIRRDAAEEIAWCGANGIGVLVYSALESGLLAGALDAARVNRLPADDWRSLDPRFRGEGLRQATVVRDTFAAIAIRHATTISAVALAWVLRWPAVTGAIVGARCATQVDGWLPATGLLLEPDDVYRIEHVLHRDRIGTGPTHA